MKCYIDNNGLIKLHENRYIDDNVVIPYKNRMLNPDVPIRIYRNLNKKGKWYSIVQFGKTIAHTTNICIRDFKCIVNQNGRKRVIKNKKKEFHAYIEGMYSTSGMGTSAARNDLPAQITYCPYDDSYFMCKNLNIKPFIVNGGRFCIINNEGIKAAYIN